MAETLQQSHEPREKKPVSTLAAFLTGGVLGGLLGAVAGRGVHGALNATHVAIGCAAGLALVALFRWVILNDVLSEASRLDPGTYDKPNVGAHAPDVDTSPRAHGPSRRPR
jgi:hypothetical protein